MKSFDKAINIFRQRIGVYKQTCLKSNGEIFSNREAFFYNIFNAQQKGGKTGHHRATVFLMTMDEGIRNQKITNTEELIKFAINYSNKGNKLSGYIWDSIRQSIGFTDAHYNYLADRYIELHPYELVDNGKFVTKEYNTRESVRFMAVHFCNDAIQGRYDLAWVKLAAMTEKDFVWNQECKTRYYKLFDYGKALLDFLNTKIHFSEHVSTRRNSF